MIPFLSLKAIFFALVAILEPVPMGPQIGVYVALTAQVCESPLLPTFSGPPGSNGLTALEVRTIPDSANLNVVRVGCGILTPSKTISVDWRDGSLTTYGPFTVVRQSLLGDI